jgi:hypothetical protein
VHACKYRPASRDAEYFEVGQWRTQMTDANWLILLGGLFILTLAFVRLCEKA